MNDPKKAYIPIVMSPGDACVYLANASQQAVAVSSRIANIILDAELTPIQAQAVLAAAWGSVQYHGKICALETCPKVGQGNQSADKYQ